jgi:RND superfamily putative drug exporter
VGEPILSQAGDTATVSIVPTTSPQDEATSQLVDRLRADVVPAAIEGTGATTYVTGQTAFQEDISTRLSNRLPMFMLAVPRSPEGGWSNGHPPSRVLSTTTGRRQCRSGG